MPRLVELALFIGPFGSSLWMTSRINCIDATIYGWWPKRFLLIRAFARLVSSRLGGTFELLSGRM